MRLTRRQNVSMTCISCTFNSTNTKVVVSDAFNNVHVYNNINSDEKPTTINACGDEMDCSDGNQAQSASVTTVNLNDKFSKKLNATNLTNIDNKTFLFTASTGLYRCEWENPANISRIERCLAGFRKIVKSKGDIFVLLGDNRIIKLVGGGNLKEFNIHELRIPTEDECRIFDISIIDASRLAIGLTDSDWNSSIQLYTMDGMPRMTKEIKLARQPVSMDFNSTFCALAYRKNKKDRSYAELIHLESGEIVRTLELYQGKAHDKGVSNGGVGRNASQAQRNSYYANMSSIHSVKFHEATGTIVLAAFGNSCVKLYDFNGEFRKDLTCDFNTSCIAFGSEGEPIMAVGGFSNKLDLFYDLMFKSHSLEI